MSDGHFWEVCLNFKFSTASLNLNYGGIFSFLNKLKFDYIKITAAIFIMRQRVTTTYSSDTLIYLFVYLFIYLFIYTLFIVDKQA